MRRMISYARANVEGICDYHGGIVVTYSQPVHLEVSHGVLRDLGGLFHSLPSPVVITSFSVTNTGLDTWRSFEMVTRIFELWYLEKTQLLKSRHHSAPGVRNTRSKGERPLSSNRR